MKEKQIKKIIGASGILLCLFAGGCGCGKKEKDPAEEQVLEITITPAVTPTPQPSEINPDAVTTSGDITMVNVYLEQKGDSGAGTNKQDDSDQNSDSQENSQDNNSEE